MVQHQKVQVIIVSERGDIILRPVVSEKSYSLYAENVYMFEVAMSATKPQIRESVEALFDVSVVKVNTLRRKGKKQHNRRNRTVGKRPDVKRAFVTLAEGDSIDMFDI